MEPGKRGCLLAIRQQRNTLVTRIPKQPREHVWQTGHGRPAPGERWSVSGDAHGSSREVGEPRPQESVMWVAGAFSLCSFPVAEAAPTPVCMVSRPAHTRLPFVPACCPLAQEVTTQLSCLCFPLQERLGLTEREEMKRGQKFPQLFQQAFDGHRGMSSHACPASSLLFSLECRRVISS